MGTILFIRIFLVSDGSDTSGVPFAIPMQEVSRNVKTLAPTPTPDMALGLLCFCVLPVRLGAELLWG